MAKQTSLVLAKSQQDIFKTMPVAWQKSAQRVLTIMQRVSENEILAKHEIGDIVRQFMAEEQKYGASAMLQLEAVSGISRSVLYQMQRLAVQFTRKELDSMITQAASSGHVVTFSHVEVLLSIPSSMAPVQREMRRLIVKEKLSVRELRERTEAKVRMYAKETSQTDRDGRPKTPLAATNRGRSLAAKYLDYLETEREAGPDRVISAGAGQITEQLLISMEEALHAHMSVHSHSAEQIEYYRPAIEHARKLMSEQKAAEALQAAAEDPESAEFEEVEVPNLPSPSKAASKAGAKASTKAAGKTVTAAGAAIQRAKQAAGVTKPGSTKLIKKSGSAKRVVKKRPTVAGPR